MSAIREEYLKELGKQGDYKDYNGTFYNVWSKYDIPIHQAYAECGVFYYVPEGQGIPWPSVEADTTFEEIGYSEVNIIQKDKGGKFVKSVSTSIKFPENSAYLHFLTCVASAMVRNFTFNLYGNKQSPVNLYTVAAQPPSTGKSGINESFTDVIREKYHALNEGVKEDRKKISIEIKVLQKGMKAAGNPNEEAQIEYDIEEKQEQLKVLGDIAYSTDDTTPEGLERMAGKQGNFFNILSAEADVLNVLLGGSYGGEAAKVNHSMILKGWDNEHVSSQRVTRDTVPGNYRGCMGVFAQDAAIIAILKAGESGRGIAERILLIREKDLLGKRDHLEYVSIDDNLIKWYDGLVENLVNAPKTIFTFSVESKLKINEYRNDIEVKMGGVGELSSALFQGFYGKGGGQVCRIACILHATRDWHKGGKKTTEVEDQTVVDAINIYNQLADSFVSVASGQGYAGNEAVAKAVIESLIEMTGADGKRQRTRLTPSGIHSITLAKFRDSKKNSKPFNQYRGLSDMLDLIFTGLSELGVCAYHNKVIYISPKLLQ